MSLASVEIVSDFGRTSPLTGHPRSVAAFEIQLNNSRKRTGAGCRLRDVLRNSLKCT